MCYRSATEIEHTNTPQEPAILGSSVSLGKIPLGNSQTLRLINIAHACVFLEYGELMHTVLDVQFARHIQ